MADVTPAPTPGSAPYGGYPIYNDGGPNWDGNACVAGSAAGALGGAAAGAQLGGYAGPWGAAGGGVVGAGIGTWGAYENLPSCQGAPQQIGTAYTIDPQGYNVTTTVDNGVVTTTVIPN